MATSACARNLIRLTLIAGLVLFACMIQWIMTHQHPHGPHESPSGRPLETHMALYNDGKGAHDDKENVNTDSKSMGIGKSFNGSSSSSVRSRSDRISDENEGIHVNVTTHEARQEEIKTKKINELKHGNVCA